MLTSIRDFILEEISRGFQGGAVTLKDVILEELSRLLQGMEARIAALIFEMVDIDLSMFNTIMNMMVAMCIALGVLIGVAVFLVVKSIKMHNTIRKLEEGIGRLGALNGLEIEGEKQYILKK